MNIGPEKLFVIALVALLIFGRRLPEVGKSLGKGIVEFKKGLKGIEDDVSQQTTSMPINRPALTQQTTEYKFDPHTGQPLQPQIANAPPGAKFDPYTGKPLTGEVVPSGTESQSSSVGI